MTKHAIRKVTGPAQARLHLGRCLGTAQCVADCGQKYFANGFCSRVLQYFHKWIERV